MGSKALGFTVEQENLIWDLHRHGESLGEIERVLGVTMPRIRRFLRESGHLEGDLVFGARPSAVATLVNRQTRAVHVVALPDGYRAETVADALIAHLGRPPAHLRRSLTWDRGREMAEHERITAALDMPVYFCAPHHPWQRGTNENTNGLLRQYLRKNADLRTLTQDDLNRVADRLNDRPRRVLDWDSPRQREEQVLGSCATG